MMKKRTIRVPRHSKEEIPEGMYQLAVRRTEHLGCRPTETLEYLLISAYMQGANDALDAVANAGFVVNK
jgi:hypothetical protein